MPIFSWDTEDDYRLRSSLRSLDGYVSTLMFKRYLSAEVFHLAGSAARTVLGTRMAALSFPTAADNYAYAGLWVPSYWVDGELHAARVFYSGDNTTGDYKLSVAVTPVGTNEVASSATQTEVLVTLSPPDNADEMESGSADPFVVDANDAFCGIRVGREGTHADDANAGSLYVFGVELYYRPKRL